MTTVGDIKCVLDELFPPETAESYDNPGLLTGSVSRTVSKTVVTLDADGKAVSKAIEEGADLIISHHPLIFGGIDSVTYDEPNGRLLSDMIKNDISLIAVHTNLDKNHEYSNRILAELLGARSGEARALDDTSCGSLFELNESVDLGTYIEIVKRSLKGTGVITYNDPGRQVKKIFAQGGSFDEDSIPAIADAGVDTVVSGEIKHHIMLLLEGYGISSIIAGHRETERVFMPNLADALQLKFPEVKFLVSL